MDILAVKEGRPFPDIEIFLFETPLYTPYPHPKDAKVIRFKGTLDGYCGYCEEKSVFHHTGHSAVIAQHWIRPPLVPSFDQMMLRCARSERHNHKFEFLFNGDFVRKIGQWPTYADIAQGIDKEYRNAMTKVDATEFYRAEGLIAHGVGIGSFVYLRRIFERIIWEALQSSKRGTVIAATTNSGASRCQTKSSC